MIDQLVVIVHMSGLSTLDKGRLSMFEDLIMELLPLQDLCIPGESAASLSSILTLHTHCLLSRAPVARPAELVIYVFTRLAEGSLGVIFFRNTT